MNAQFPRQRLALRDSNTTRIIRSIGLAAGFLTLGATLSACGRHHANTARDAQSSASPLAQLKCGNTTYNLPADKIDTEVNEACDRVNTSFKMHQSSRDRARFTCQDGRGHILESVLVPDALLSDYDKSCQEYVAADLPFENGTADRQAHFDALKRFQTETNQLTRRTMDEANANWRRNRADQAVLNKLIKNRGGSIAIAD